MTAAPARRAGVLITRPEPDASATAARLAAMGFAPLTAPLLTVEPIAFDIATGPAQGLVFTSARGVERWAAMGGRTDLPAWAVGTRSARAARDAGFETVHAGDGDGASLADLMRREIDPEHGPLIWPCGADRSVELGEALAPAGIAIDRREAYRTRMVEDLPAETIAALRAGSVAWVLFYSLRTARAFAELAARHRLRDSVREIAAGCLSPRIRDGLGALAFADIRIPPAPSEEALLALLAQGRTVRLDRSTADDGAQRMTNDRDTPTPPDLPDADSVIARFGGVRPMAAKLGMAVSTVQGWKQRNHIPENRWEDIRAAATVHGIDLHGATPDAAPETGPPARRDDAEPPPPEMPHSKTPGPETPGPVRPPAETPWAKPAESDREKPTAQAHAASDTAPADADAAPPPAPPHGAPAGPAPARRGSGLAVLALTVALVALIGALTRPAWAPMTDPLLADWLGLPAEPSRTNGVDAAVQTAMTPLSAEIAALEERLRALETAPPPDVSDVDADALADATARLDALEARQDARDQATDEALAALTQALEALPPPPDLGGLSAALNARGDALEARLAALEARLADQEAALAGFGDRLDRQAEARRDAGAREAALVLAVGQLDRAIAARDGTAAAALQDLRALGDGDADVIQAVARIERALEAGAPSRAALSADFARLAPSLAAAPAAGARDSLGAAVLANVGALISIRRVDEDAAQATPVGRAEALVMAGDLAGAADLLADLPAAADWVAAARNRLALEAALADLRGQALARLRAAAGPPSARRPAPEVPPDAAPDTADGETAG